MTIFYPFTIDDISDLPYTKTFPCQAFTIPANKSIGEYITSATIDISLTNYTPINIYVSKSPHSGTYLVTTYLLHSLQLIGYTIYKASSSTGSYSTGEITFNVLYKHIY